MSLERRARVPWPSRSVGRPCSMRLLSLLSLLAGIGCRDVAELDPQERRPSAADPEAGGRSRTISIRNTCPEQVELAIAASEPGPTTPTMKLGSTRVTTVTVEPGARIWLRSGGRFEVDLSVIPTGPVEVGFQCDAIYASTRGR